MRILIAAESLSAGLAQAKALGEHDCAVAIPGRFPEAPRSRIREIGGVRCHSSVTTIGRGPQVLREIARSMEAEAAYYLGGHTWVSRARAHLKGLGLKEAGRQTDGAAAIPSTIPGVRLFRKVEPPAVRRRADLPTRIENEWATWRDWLAERLEAAQERPLLSVLSPTNRPYFWPRLLLNFQRQTWENKELIVLVDDHNLKRARRFWGPIPGVRVVCIGKAPLGESFNIGMLHAKGAIVIRMDDDDFYHADYLATHACLHAAIDQSVMTGLDSMVFHFSQGDHFRLYTHQAVASGYADKPAIKNVGHVSGHSMGWSRKLWEQIRYQGLGAYEDMQFKDDVLSAGASILSMFRFAAAVGRRPLEASDHTWTPTQNRYEDTCAPIPDDELPLFTGWIREALDEEAAWQANR